MLQGKRAEEYMLRAGPSTHGDIDAAQYACIACRRAGMTGDPVAHHTRSCGTEGVDGLLERGKPDRPPHQDAREAGANVCTACGCRPTRAYDDADRTAPVRGILRRVTRTTQRGPVAEVAGMT